MTKASLRRALAQYIKEIADDSDCVIEADVEQFNLILSRDFDSLYADVTLKTYEENISVNFDPNQLDQSIDILVTKIHNSFGKIKSKIVNSGEIF